MRNWFACRFRTFPFCPKQRQRYLDDCGDLVATYPLFRRLWCRYLHWIVTSARTKIIISAEATNHRGASIFYKALDRLTGGERYRRYVERRLVEIETREKEPKASESVRKLREFIYDLRVLQESIKNPNFAEPPEKVQ